MNASLNTTSSEESDEKYGLAIMVGISLYYTVVFIFATVGNVFILAAVYKFQHMKKTVNMFLANLACADLLFALLSAFDFHVFLRHGAWMFGNAFCKIQSASLEVSYTVSVLTLTAVSLERYFSICYPYRKRRTRTQTVLISALLWFLSAGFCAVLLFSYHLVNDSCVNNNWTESNRLTFYTVHSVVVYVLPVIVMSCSHHKISRSLYQQQKRCLSDDNKNNKMQKRSLKKNAKSIRLLVAVIVIFFVLWTPFVITRLLKYSGVDVPVIFWRLTQLLVLSTTALNCVIYSAMSKPFRQAFTALLWCRRNVPGRTVSENNASRNSDYRSRNNQI